MIQILKPNGAEVCTEGLRINMPLLIKTTEADDHSDVDVIDLRNETFLAFAMSSFTKQRYVNQEATSILRKHRREVAQRVFGTAVLFTADEVDTDE
jgi:hypothetical protein